MASLFFSQEGDKNLFYCLYLRNLLCSRHPTKSKMEMVSPTRKKMGNMNIQKRYLLIPGLLAVFALMFYLIYEDIKNRTVDEFNKEQLVLAKTASQGIASFFDNYNADLLFMAKIPDIANNTEKGKKLMETYFESHKGSIEALTRVDAKGIIAATSPLSQPVIGKSILHQEHIQIMVETHRPVISDVFMSAQGFLAIAMHVPVFIGDTFAGSLAILISIDKLGKRYLSQVTDRGIGHAWLLSEHAVEIYCPLPEHTGKLFLDNVQYHPSARKLLDSIEKRPQGFFKLSHHYDKTSSAERYITFYRTNLGNTYWTIVLSYPEQVIYLSLTSFRNRLLLLFTLLLAVLVFAFYSIIRANNVLKEEEKRKTIENALRESDRLKSAFINNISHEIRTPMNGIIGFGEILVNEAVTKSERREYLKILKNSTDRLIQTVTDYMDISLIVSGTLKMANSRFSVVQLMKECFDQTRLPCQEKGIDLHLELPAGGADVTICSDHELLRKALDHLLRNAVKYTHRGEIRFGYFLRDDSMEFFVRDTGRGISANQMEEIFEPFRQGDHHRVRHHDGSGLGLSIVKGIVALLGGKVWVESRQGEIAEGDPSGSVFRFTLPHDKSC
jgi:signal transduction histidine kinase